jgi:hypothetical protein
MDGVYIFPPSVKIDIGMMFQLFDSGEKYVIDDIVSIHTGEIHAANQVKVSRAG